MGVNGEEDMKREKWLLALGLAVAVDLGPSTLHAASIIDEWASVQVPPAPALKPVTVDAKTTALLIFDLVKPFCNPERYTRCPSMLPAVNKLATEARAKGVMVIYTSIPSVPKTAIVDELTPTANDMFMQSGTDKFLNTDLEKILKAHATWTDQGRRRRPVLMLIATSRTSCLPPHSPLLHHRHPRAFATSSTTRGVEGRSNTGNLPSQLVGIKRNFFWHVWR